MSELNTEELIRSAEILEMNEDHGLAGNIYFHLLRKNHQKLSAETQFSFASKCLQCSSRSEYLIFAARWVIRFAAPLGKIQEALACLESNLHKFQNEAELLSAMATLSLQVGDSLKARGFIHSALERDPTHESALRLFELVRSS